MAAIGRAVCTGTTPRQELGAGMVLFKNLWVGSAFLQWLRALDALAEDPSLVHSTYTAIHNCL